MGTPTGEDPERSRYVLRARQSKVDADWRNPEEMPREVIQAPPTQGKSRPQREDTASVTALLAVGGRDPAENSLGYFFGI